MFSNDSGSEISVWQVRPKTLLSLVIIFISVFVQSHCCYLYVSMHTCTYGVNHYYCCYYYSNKVKQSDNFPYETYDDTGNVWRSSLCCFKNTFWLCAVQMYDRYEENSITIRFSFLLTKQIKHNLFLSFQCYLKNV